MKDYEVTLKDLKQEACKKDELSVEVEEKDKVIPFQQLLNSYIPN